VLSKYLFIFCFVLYKTFVSFVSLNTLNTFTQMKAIDQEKEKRKALKQINSVFKGKKYDF
jgi:predicted ABC-type exoprotein transport system permease subunit